MNELVALCKLLGSADLVVAMIDGERVATDPKMFTQLGAKLEAMERLAEAVYKDWIGPQSCLELSKSWPKMFQLGQIVDASKVAAQQREG